MRRDMEEITQILTMTQLIATARFESYRLMEQDLSLGDLVDAFLVGATACLYEKLGKLSESKGNDQIANA
jgi:hypothetical protein